MKKYLLLVFYLLILNKNITAQVFYKREDVYNKRLIFYLASFISFDHIGYKTDFLNRTLPYNFSLGLQYLVSNNFAIGHEFQFNLNFYKSDLNLIRSKYNNIFENMFVSYKNNANLFFNISQSFSYFPFYNLNLEFNLLLGLLFNLKIVNTDVYYFFSDLAIVSDTLKLIYKFETYQKTDYYYNFYFSLLFRITFMFLYVEYAFLPQINVKIIRESFSHSRAHRISLGFKYIFVEPSKNNFKGYK